MRIILGCLYGKFCCKWFLGFFGVKFYDNVVFKCFCLCIVSNDE